MEKKPEEEVEFSPSGYEDIMYNEVEPKEEAGITDLNTGELITFEEDEEDIVEEVTEAETTNTNIMTLRGSSHDTNLHLPLDKQTRSGQRELLYYCINGTDS